MHIAEEVDSVVRDGDWDEYLTGTFSGHLERGSRSRGSFEQLSLDEALAWAHERADKIVLRVGFEPRYALGFDDELATDERPWPAEGVPAPKRRRVPCEAWKDRTDADPDADWVVMITLGPPDPQAERFEDDPRLPEWDEVAASVAAAMDATWSGEPFDAHRGDMHEAQGRARRSGGEVAWHTMHPRAYQLRTTVRAPTHAQAEAVARAAIPSLPEGWSAEVVDVAFAADD